VRVTPRTSRDLIRFVPRVAALRPLIVSALVTGLFVVAADSAAVAAMRMRPAGALVAAATAFVIDDDAAATLAASPVTRLRRRAARWSVAASVVGGWLVLVPFLADARTGSGRPPAAAFAECAALALIAQAGACLAIGRTDDGRGGIFGVATVGLCFLGAYLPLSQWWPLEEAPHTRRLALVSATALAVALAASADPARPRIRRLAPRS
jgi:hypothetical protein